VNDLKALNPPRSLAASRSALGLPKNFSAGTFPAPKGNTPRPPHSMESDGFPELKPLFENTAELTATSGEIA
jgi:hypothetical protein